MPLYGAIFQGWNVLDILLVYWVENVIIGVLTVVKMLMALVAQNGFFGTVFGLFHVAFFCFHYGMFTTVHGALIYAIFGNGPFAKGGIKPEYWHYLYGPFMPGEPLFFSAVSICLWQLVSFFKNFVGGDEYKTVKPSLVMFQPYGRIAILHVVILAGGFLAMKAGSNIAALALLVLIKIVIDIALYHKAHNPAANPLAVSARKD